MAISSPARSVIWKRRSTKRLAKHLILIRQNSLGVVLFENMKLPGGRKTKTGYSTAADVLEKLAPVTSGSCKDFGIQTVLQSSNPHMRTDWQIIFRMMEGFMENSIRRSRQPEESAVQNQIFRIFRCGWSLAA